MRFHTVLRGLLWAALNVGIWIFTHGALMVFDRWFEYVLYPKSILALGATTGIAVMTIVSFLICWGLIVLYDWFARLEWSHVRNPIALKFLTGLQDALGFETLKETAGKVRSELFTPAEFVSVSVSLPERLQWLTLPALVVMEVLALVRNIGVWIWEVLRLFLIAPVAGLLFRHRLEKAALFLYTSLWHDPMTCLILMRPTRTYGMGKKEWGVFLASVVIGNVGWGALIAVGMRLIQTHLPLVWHYWLLIINIFT